MTEYNLSFELKNFLIKLIITNERIIATGIIKYK